MYIHICMYMYIIYICVCCIYIDMSSDVYIFVKALLRLY